MHSVFQDPDCTAMVLRMRVKKPTSRRKSIAGSQLRLMTENFQKAKKKKQETKRNLLKNMKSKTRMNINPDIDAELAAIENEPKGKTNVVTLKGSAGESRKIKKKKKQKEAGGGTFTVALTASKKPSLSSLPLIAIQEIKDDSSGLDDNDEETPKTTRFRSPVLGHLGDGKYVQEDSDYWPFEFSSNEAGNISPFSYSVLPLIMIVNGYLVQPLFVWSNA